MLSENKYEVMPLRKENNLVSQFKFDFLASAVVSQVGIIVIFSTPAQD
jgi:hypothetical protein